MKLHSQMLFFPSKWFFGTLEIDSDEDFWGELGYVAVCLKLQKTPHVQMARWRDFGAPEMSSKQLDLFDCWRVVFHQPFPIPSMYGIFTYISWIYICIYGKCRCSKYTYMDGTGWKKYAWSQNWIKFSQGWKLNKIWILHRPANSCGWHSRNHHPVLDVLTKTYRNLGNKPPNRWPVMKGLEVLLFKKLL